MASVHSFVGVGARLFCSTVGETGQAYSLRAMADEDPKPTSPAPPWWPALWAVVGAGLTLAVVIGLRVSNPAASTALPPSASPSVSVSFTETAESTPRAEFAGLYLSYLLKTYYVYERGFCTALLKEICTALLRTELLNIPSTCDTVPNDELVLAIGRFQHKTALPVDGKAGPETVRKILGGTFNNRSEMAAKYCPGWKPPAPASPGSSASADAHAPATVEW